MKHICIVIALLAFSLSANAVEPATKVSGYGNWLFIDEYKPTQSSTEYFSISVNLNTLLFANMADTNASKTIVLVIDSSGSSAKPQTITLFFNSRTDLIRVYNQIKDSIKKASN